MRRKSAEPDTPSNYRKRFIPDAFRGSVLPPGNAPWEGVPIERMRKQEGFDIEKFGEQGLPPRHQFTPADPETIVPMETKALIPTERNTQGNYVFQHSSLSGLEHLGTILHKLTATKDGPRVEIKCRKVGIVYSNVSVFELFETDNDQRFAWEAFPHGRHSSGYGYFMTEAQALERVEVGCFRIARLGDDARVTVTPGVY